ncbi:MAG: hypothetical protein GX221_01680 [Candidatus Riflebacteria bacterium]|nr:hypothetical protein [Candidatus Riflebacteria bacterium]
MEFLIIAVSSTIQTDVLTLFKKHNIKNYTLFTQVMGSGEGGGKRMNTEVWPGENTVFMVACDPEKADIIRKWGKHYREESIREGLQVFTLQLQSML